MRGTALAEILIALALVLIVVTGVARVAADADAAFRAQPEAADLLQRARVGLEALCAELVNAGGGPFLLTNAQALVRSVPPVIPRRLGRLRPDAETEAFDDWLTILTIPDGAPQADVRSMASAADPLDLDPGPWCPAGDPACGFAPDEAALVFDRTGTFDLFAVREVRPLAIVPDHGLVRAFAAADSARVAGVNVTVYAFDRARQQLRRYDGRASDVPVIDHVVAFAVRYFGDPLPPLAPVPPTGEENCIVDREGRPRLPAEIATFGALVELPVARLRDGPWCGAVPNRFDADLYRVRQLRVTLRVEAASPAVRGRSRRWFVNPGRALHPAAAVPDLEIEVDVSPRNLRVS